MQRLIEQPTSDGELFEGSVRLGRVHYHLSVYQQFSEGDGEPVPGHCEVEGRLIPADAVDLSALHERRPELTLRLADGRALDCSLSDRNGRVRSTGRGLYQQ